MPAFSYKSTAKLPGSTGKQAATGVKATVPGKLSAPQLTAPMQQAATIGNTQQMQPGFEREDNRAANAMVKLGETLFNQSMAMADEQSSMEADEAVNRYRRTVSDSFYNKDGGLFAQTGAQGAQVYTQNGSKLDEIRDELAEKLSPSAKRKYLVKVQGYSHSYHDQLARKQMENRATYKEQVLAMREGSDAEDMYSFLREGNIRAVVSTIRDNPSNLNDQEKQERQDRLVMSVLQSADAMNLDAQSVSNVYESVKHLASQNVQNEMAESVDDYKVAEMAEKERQERAYKEAIGEQREKNFSTLLEKILVEKDPNISVKDAFKTDMTASQRKTLISAISANAEKSQEQVKDRFLIHAERGTLDHEALGAAVASGHLTAGHYLEITKEAKKAAREAAFPEKASGNATQAFQLVDAVLKKEDPVEWSRAKRDLRAYIEKNPDTDPLPWVEQYLEPKKAWKVTRFMNGIFGNGSSKIRDDGMEKYQQFTSSQREAYEAIKAKYSELGKGDIDQLPEAQVEDIVNTYLEENGFGYGY